MFALTFGGIQNSGKTQVGNMDLVHPHQGGDQSEPPSNAPVVEKHPDTVSGIHKCQSSDARKLCIYELSHKLTNPDTYHIGGTYTDENPDLWFYYSTSVCPGDIFLLNLFVFHRKAGGFSIGVSEASEPTLSKKSEIPNQLSLPEKLTWYTFRSGHPNENHYIKTFNFNKSNLKALESNSLCIPFKIVTKTQQIVNNDVIRQIKLKHDLSDLLLKQEKTDFILESVTKKQYPTHRIILAAHSPVLREMIKNTTSKSAFIDINDNDMELLLQFIYTGTIKDIHKQDCLKLLEIADRFKLNNLFLLTQYAINEQINVTNAVEVAILSEKFSLDMLQSNVFVYIRNHPEILETEGWKNLSDVKLAKKLFSFTQNQTARD